MTRCILRVIREVPGNLGGISALRGVADWSPQEAADFFGKNLRTTRVMVVDVEGGLVTILHDQTFADRIDSPQEERRAARLDNVYDTTVHDVLWPECPHESCVHLEPMRAV